MDTLPIIQKPLSEVTVPSHDTEAAVEMYNKLQEGLIPVFVLSAAGVEFGEDEDKAATMLDKAKAVVERATGMPYEKGVRFDILVNPGRGGDAPLHADDAPSNDAEEYHVHSTFGEVKGHFANPGPNLAASGINERYDKRLNDLFADGKTDPTLMDPTVYSGPLKDGDTAVFRIKGKAPSFHKIETVGTDRFSVATALSPAPQQQESPPVVAHKVW